MSATLDRLQNNYEKATLELARSREDAGGDPIDFHINLSNAMTKEERAKRKLANHIAGKTSSTFYVSALLIVVALLGITLAL